MENPWFRRGLYPKTIQMKKEITDVADDEIAAVKPTHALAQPTYLNAFYILSLSFSQGRHGGMMKLETPRECRKEPLIICAEIFEFAPSLDIYLRVMNIPLIECLDI
ncbi:unnamed protein product [Vicia faba]|uniref:Uncharacterized protein n=1 Tax=Vicia faba TaxID=3906 RepID=A0AAV0ZJQ7_VICFA|nr:unnamed protein product [Vicia faba]